MRLRTLLVALLLVFLASPAAAASINYGDLVGISVKYLQVTEDSVTDPTPLFGAPSSAETRSTSIRWDSALPPAEGRLLMSPMAI
jgi:hypothetical protein